jgi:hypothetical protein
MLQLSEAVNGLAEHLVAIMKTRDFASNLRALTASLHGFALIHCAGATEISRNTRVKLALAEHIETVMRDMEPRDLTQTVWSFAKLGWCTTDVQALLASIDARSCEMMDESSRPHRPGERGGSRFEGVDLANILQALHLVDTAQCQWAPSEGWLHRLETHAAREAWDLTTQGVVTVITGLAKLERDVCDEVKARLCLRAIQVVSAARSNDVSNLCWGMAKLG